MDKWNLCQSGYSLLRSAAIHLSGFDCSSIQRQKSAPKARLHLHAQYHMPSANSSQSDLCVSQRCLNSLDVVELVKTDAVFQQLQITFNVHTVHVKCIQLLTVLLL